MRTLTARALDCANGLGAQYADVRGVVRRIQTIAITNGVVETMVEEEYQGFGVRLLIDGAWGFSGSATLELGAVDQVTAQAAEIARASARFKTAEVRLGPRVSSVGVYRTPVLVNPWEISPVAKIALLLQADRELRHAGAATAKANLLTWQENKVFANSEGALTEQELIHTGGGVTAIAVDKESGQVQTRSYPGFFGTDVRGAGWETILEMDLPGNAQRIGEEAVALLRADECPSGHATVILGPSQLAIQTHESVGHAIELDRVFGAEGDFTGTSFLSPAMLNSFAYGSGHVNITADATAPGGVGTFGWDDEGVPAQRVPIVRDGILCGFLSSRESIEQLRQVVGDRAPASSGGAMIADGWHNIPLVRMTNVNVDPGEWDLAELIADTDDGIWMDSCKTYSIDDRRLNFQFGVEYAREIKHGKLGRLLKNGSYAGSTPQFWASCDGVCNRDHWRIWGISNCGKGQPGQMAHTGHGTAPARFRNVRVGIRS